MVFDLRPYGFPKTIFSEDLKDISNNLPEWNRIHAVVRKQIDPTLIIEYFISPIKQDISENYYPIYIWGQKLDEGTYGKIYTCLRKTYSNISYGKITIDKSEIKNFETIVIKETPLLLSDREKYLSKENQTQILIEEFNAHLHEATVLTLAYIAAKKRNMEKSIPRIYEVFTHRRAFTNVIEDVKSLCIAMEYIHGETLQKYLHRRLNRLDRPNNDLIFLDCLKQFANLIDVLQESLRMNHRDIKINNILLRDSHSDNPILVLIDYGFACIANGEQNPHSEMSQIEAGSYFGSRYSCFKHGRDIFQYIYCIHCYYPLQHYLSENLYALLSKWMTLEYEGKHINMLDGISVNGTPLVTLPPVVSFNEGIYIFLKKPHIDPLNCSPKKVIADIENYLNM